MPEEPRVLWVASEARAVDISKKGPGYVTQEGTQAMCEHWECVCGRVCPCHSRCGHERVCRHVWDETQAGVRIDVSA